MISGDVKQKSYCSQRNRRVTVEVRGAFRQLLAANLVQDIPESVPNEEFDTYHME